MRNPKLGSFIREARRAKGLSQSELARALGYHPQFISNWERGESRPPMEKLAALSRLLGVRRRKLVEIYLKAAKQS